MHLILSVPNQCKTQGMYDKILSKHPFMLKYCYDRYKTQEMCGKVVNGFLPALKVVPNLFVTSKTIKKLHTALFADYDILFFYKDSSNVTFSSN